MRAKPPCDSKRRPIGSNALALSVFRDRYASDDRRDREGLDQGISAARISDRFHSTLAAMIESTCVEIRESNAIETVCLSGGTFQNQTLLARCIAP